MTAAVRNYTADKERRMPEYPRIKINGVICLPAVNEDWQVIDDLWILPGGKHATTGELTDWMRTTGGTLEFINQPKEK